VCAAFGGKGGGKPKGDVAQGNIPDPSIVKVVAAKANEVAKGKLH